MGLLRSGIQMGGLYAITNSAMKTYTASQQQQQQPQQQAAAPTSQSQTRRAIASNSTYPHKNYCDGSCGDHCNPVGCDGYVHKAYCDGSCGEGCNPQFGGQVREVGRTEAGRGPPAYETLGGSGALGSQREVRGRVVDIKM